MPVGPLLLQKMQLEALSVPADVVLTPPATDVATLPAKVQLRAFTTLLETPIQMAAPPPEPVARLPANKAVGVGGVAAAVCFHPTSARCGVVAEDAAGEGAGHGVRVECTTVTAAIVVIELAVGKRCLRGEDVTRATTECAAVRSKDAIANGWCTT